MDERVFLEFHALCTHAPGSLNRDDVGMPKTAIFGGVPRLRISSQCLKRTWRTSPWFQGALAEELMGVRTAVLPATVLQRLIARGAPPLGAREFVAVVARLGSKISRPGATEEPSEGEDGEGRVTPEAVTPAGYRAPRSSHVLFMSRPEIDALVTMGEREAGRLDASAKAAQGRDAKGRATKSARGALTALRSAQGDVRRHIAEAVASASATRAADIALFGRWLTSDEIPTVDGSLSVAHAIGVQSVEIETDFFSAVDDLAADTRGSAFIGESMFASATFYKYAVADVSELLRNLANDPALAARLLGCLATAIFRATPRGKEHSTAPHSPADYLGVVRRRTAPVSLANAFIRPIAADARLDVMDRAIRALRGYQRKLDDILGADEVQARLVLTTRDDALGEALPDEKVHSSLASLIQGVSALLPAAG